MEDMYQMETEEIIKITNSKIDGLSEREAKERLKNNGLNKLPTKKEDSVITMFLKELKSPIIYILLITTILSFVIGEIIDGIFILIVILADAILGTFQEWKAEKNSLALQNLIKVETRVIRSGKEKLIDSEKLVVGDIVLLSPGDKVSADLRLIESSNLTIDEAILTGESIASNKNCLVIKDKRSISDMDNMAFAGTSVLTGRAKATVVKTGINTEIGKIADKVLTTDDTKSTLIIKTEKLTKQLGIFVSIVAVLLTLILYMKNYAPKEIFFSVIALSVSAIPEGLSMAITLALSIASSRMAKKNVIVKKLNSVESLGSCTVIASDKTGTLTLNEQTAKKILLPNGDSFEISGIGYNGEGSINVNKKNQDQVFDLIKMGAINNEASLIKKNDTWESYGDSIDIAFLSLAYKANIKYMDIQKLSEIPYESENQYSAISFKENDETYYTVKGSLEKVLSFCNKVQIGTVTEKIDVDVIKQQNEFLAREGYRVIAIAKGKKKGEKIENLTFLGLVGFIDPIREEVIGAIKKCNKSGIKTVMITGDHPLTAYAISKELKLVNSFDEVTNGEELEKYFNMGIEKFDEFIKTKRVFTRVTPMQKLEIVESYKRQNEYVAVTGDGVNDAPALKSANIGIAMGSGTDVAKETSSMIITDDNFSSIVAGIEEGRNAYNNIRKVIYLLFSCGIAEVLFFTLSIIFNLPLPLLAIQLLWLNLVTDGIQDAALSFEREIDGIMDEHPRKTNENIFNKLLIEEVLLSGIFIGIIVFIFWRYLIVDKGVDINIARSYILILMVFMQNMHTFNCRSEKKSLFKLSFKNNPLIIVGVILTILVQMIVIEIPFTSDILKVHSLPIKDVLLTFVLAMPILIVMEIFKLINQKKLKSR